MASKATGQGQKPHDDIITGLTYDFDFYRNPLDQCLDYSALITFHFCCLYIIICFFGIIMVIVYYYWTWGSC